MEDQSLLKAKDAALGTSQNESKDVDSDLTMKFKIAATSRTRIAGESCVVPSKLLHKVDVGIEGALCLEFSPDGQYLAVASNQGGGSTGFPVPFPGTMYGIRLVDADLGTTIWKMEAAHYGPIYRVRWNKESNLLLTASGDGTCKLWKLAKKMVSSTSAGKEVESEVLTISLLATLEHNPANIYIYTCLFQEAKKSVFKSRRVEGLESIQEDVEPVSDSPSYPRIFTGASDGHIRVWELGKQVGQLSRDETVEMLQALGAGADVESSLPPPSPSPQPQEEERPQSGRSSRPITAAEQPAGRGAAAGAGRGGAVLQVGPSGHTAFGKEPLVTLDMFLMFWFGN